MNHIWGNDRKTDLHIHTNVSDGEMSPKEAIIKAKNLGLKNISLTDHDTLGAYTNLPDDPRKIASREGINLVVGTELDSDYKGIEIHVLGYNLNLDNPDLLSYLKKTSDLRKIRIQDFIVKINKQMGKEVIREEEIFLPCRKTYMKPHIIRPLLKEKYFTQYKDAARWIKSNITPGIALPKLHTFDIIALIKKAGGLAFLAHPGYYSLECSLNVNNFIQELVLKGLDGIEVYYPYFGTTRNFSSRKMVAEVINLLRNMADKYGLLASKGSDSHTADQLARSNKF